MSEKKERDKELNIWDHLTELSARLRVIFYSVIIGTVLMMALPGNLDFLKNPLEFYTPLVAVILNKIKNDMIGGANIKVIGLELTAPLELYLVASLVFGFIISIPVIAYEIYRYLDPALHEHERRPIYTFVAAFSILFATGVIFAYVILAPFMIRALIPFFTAVGAEAVISVKDFYNLIFAFCLASGFTFTFPAFFVLLVKYGILSTSLLTKNRRYVYAALFIIVAVATPDGGIPADLMLFAPMVILMESSVLFGRHFEKQREKEERQKQSS